MGFETSICLVLAVFLLRGDNGLLESCSSQYSNSEMQNHIGCKTSIRRTNEFMIQRSFE